MCERTVYMTDIPSGTTIDDLCIYFQTRKKSRGGDIASIDLDKERNEYKIVFEEEQVARNVLLQDHVIQDHHITVSRRPSVKLLRMETGKEVYAGNDKDLSNAIKAIEERARDNSKKMPIENPCIGRLSKNQKDQILRLQETYDTKIVLEQPINRIVIHGDSDDVSSVTTAVYAILNQKTEEDHTREVAELLSKNIQWYYVDGEDQEPYDSEVNHKIEQAYQAGKKSVVVFLCEDGSDKAGRYEISFQDTMETNLDTKETTQVIRKERGKGYSDRQARKISESDRTTDIHHLTPDISLLAYSDRQARKISESYRTTGIHHLRQDISLAGYSDRQAIKISESDRTTVIPHQTQDISLAGYSDRQARDKSETEWSRVYSDRRQQRNNSKSERTADIHHVTQVIPLPAHWDPQPKDSRNNEEEVHLVTLDPVKDADEFHKVMGGALLTADMIILQIQRVQNPLLYRFYALKKLTMDEGKDSNERKLFHGTDPATCDLINHKGFNRSFCGKNGAKYGKGVYFARDAKYSANTKYSLADTRGRRCMYMASVLVGDYTKGKSGLLTPPSKNLSLPTVTYDTVVDNTSNPGIYVVFNDNQCYPDYLITFN